MQPFCHGRKNQFYGHIVFARPLRQQSSTIDFRARHSFYFYSGKDCCIVHCMVLDLNNTPLTPGPHDAALEALCAQHLTAPGCGGFTVRVKWSRRMKTTAGLADWKTNTITLNAALKECAPGEIGRTLFHELAHLLAHHRAGKKRIPPHGEAWQTACHDLGIGGEKRCHNLPFERKKRERKFFYRCPRCAKTIARVRRMRVKAACLDCCKKFNNGRFDERFRLRLEQGEKGT